MAAFTTMYFSPFTGWASVMFSHTRLFRSDCVELTPIGRGDAEGAGAALRINTDGDRAHVEEVILSTPRPVPSNVGR